VVDKGADGQTSVRQLIPVRFSRLVQSQRGPMLSIKSSSCNTGDHWLAVVPAPFSRANLRSRSRSAVGGYAVSVSQNPLRKHKESGIILI
jgi:hypothetical protein